MNKQDLIEWDEVCKARGCNRTIGGIQSDIKDMMSSDRRKVSVQFFTWIVGFMWVIFAFIMGGVVTYVYTTNNKQDEHIAENRKEVKDALMEINKNFRELQVAILTSHGTKFK
jgi:predicted DNA-binding transcriptional regulator